MKKYIIKETITGKEVNYTAVNYLGKNENGAVVINPNSIGWLAECHGYKSRKTAQKRIDNEIEYYSNNRNFKYTFEILEVEVRG